MTYFAKLKRTHPICQRTFDPLSVFTKQKGSVCAGISSSQNLPVRSGLAEGYHAAHWCQGRYRFPLTPLHRHDQGMISQFESKKTVSFPVSKTSCLAIRFR